MNKTNSVCDNCGLDDCAFKSGTGDLNPATRKECIIPTLRDRNPDLIRKKKELAAIDESTAKARVWMGNQYWDEKAKDWRDGDKPIRIHRIPTWLVIIGLCILISILITVILNFTNPGSSYSFWIW